MQINEVKIVFENENFLVIDKPQGLVVHGDGRTEEMSLVDFLALYFENPPAQANACVDPLYKGDTSAEVQKNIGNPHTLDSGRYIERWGIVNRLDRDTAGLILVAKNQITFNELQKLFQEQKITKKYEALVWGNVDFGDHQEMVVDEKITRHKKDPRIWTCGFASFEGGRQTGLEALTIVRKVKYFPEKNWTLLSLIPKTGRTHQLRLHCRFLGHPIVGDDKYGLNGKINEHSMRQIEHLTQPLLGKERSTVQEMDKKEKLKLIARSLEFELFGEGYSFESSFIL